MKRRKNNQEVPIYNLVPDNPTGTKDFKIYNLKGSCPNRSELLIPHRKDHYLIAFVRCAGNRQWIDMTPYTLKENTIYFTGPGHVIVKEGLGQIWSTAIAFTEKFLSFQENSALSRLPILVNAQNRHELLLSASDVQFVEDILSKINIENDAPGPWHFRMLTAYITVFLTYLSRLYTEQFKEEETSAERLLLKSFQAKIDTSFREMHEVIEYASQLYISAGHLSEVVKIQSGKSAIKHIHERLVLEARRLLFHTDNTLKEIAFDLGFAEASYFNRFFKRETGITPAAYRANIREMYH